MSGPALNGGGSPRRMAWAPWTIMLPAAWRKMWVRRTVGTSADSTSSANGLPAPTGASWSASPTRTTWVRAPTARSRTTSSSRLAIEHSSRISRSHSSGSSASLVGPSPGTQPSAEWTVVARMPLASVIRIAARPVGATSITFAPRSAARPGDRADRCRLARSGAAGDHRQPVRKGVRQARLLLAGQRLAGRRLRVGRLTARRRACATAARSSSSCTRAASSASSSAVARR